MSLLSLFHRVWLDLRIDSHQRKAMHLRWLAETLPSKRELLEDEIDVLSRKLEALRRGDKLREQLIVEHESGGVIKFRQRGNAGHSHATSDGQPF